MSGLPLGFTMALPSRTITGRIAYLSADGTSWGRESFSVSVHDAGRVIRAVSELDDVGLLRDTNWSLSSQWAPLEGFVRTIAKGATTSHSWFNIADREVEYQGFTAQLGRVSQKLVAPGRIEFLGFHALVGDGFIAAARGRTDPGAEKTIICATNSFAAYGDEGLTALVGMPRVTYCGSERISVAAGTFDSEHFIVRWSDAMPSPSEFWVLPEEYVLLRMIGAIEEARYELVDIDFGLAGSRPISLSDRR